MNRHQVRGAVRYLCIFLLGMLAWWVLAGAPGAPTPDPCSGCPSLSRCASEAAPPECPRTTDDASEVDHELQK